MVNKFRYFVLAAACALPTAAMACNPSAMLEGGGGSVNYKSSLDGSSNCFMYNGLVDAAGTAAFPNVAVAADATALPTTLILRSVLMGYNGTTLDLVDTVNTGTLKTDMSSIAGTVTVTGGVAGLQAVGGPVASGGANADNPLKVGGVFNTTQPTVTNSQIVDLQATARGGLIVSTGVDTFNTTINAALPAGTNLLGKVGIDQTTPGTTNAVQEVPGTAGGTSAYFVQPTASDNHVVIAAGAHQVYYAILENNSATINYVRLYNATTGFNGCNSATNLVTQLQVPASTAVGGIVVPFYGGGLTFATGLSICVTSGYATTDVTAATASAMSITIGYK